MNIDNRKMKILAMVVDEYIKTGEPVGSKKISEKMGIAVSSATIRNDMGSLEKMGLLEQPYTSAGRVPTYMGYRFYISNLMEPKILSENERALIDSSLTKKETSAEAIVSNALDALVELTGCPAVNLNNIPKFSVITRVEVIPAGRRLYALLLITSSGEIKNRICRAEFDLTYEQLDFFANVVNSSISGKRAEDLNPATLQSLAVGLGSYMMSLSPLLYAVYELSGQLMKDNMYVKGESKLLSYKDFNTNEALRFLSTREELVELLKNALDGVNIMFGKEKDQFFVTNSSLIISKHKIGDGEGTFGIIGPIRLDYAKIIPYVEYFSDSVSKIVEDMMDEKNE